MLARFHLSFCVDDLESTRRFYGDVLQCAEGTTHTNAVDFSFFGHQITCHVDPAHVRRADIDTLDGNHFGAIVDMEEFHRIRSRLQERDVTFIAAPVAQHRGTARERWKMVVADPSGNAIEFKGYADESQVFGRHE